MLPGRLGHMPVHAGRSLASLVTCHRMQDAPWGKLGRMRLHTGRSLTAPRLVTGKADSYENKLQI